MAIDAIKRSVVGALSCQKDSYLETLETEVISCEYILPKDDRKSNSKKSTRPSNGDLAQRTWMIEFADSVLFPEGGGQHTDYGFITPLEGKDLGVIRIENIQRHGLRCLHSSPSPLELGTKVKQTVDYPRRWDLMQQHTGQHLLSAIMDNMDLPTLGWSMGQPGEMNYVELPRKPTDEEIRLIQLECNAAIRSNLHITVETPKDKDSPSLPLDYDGAAGVVRFIKIGDLDYNACCGTHLKQTSHINLILLHHTQSIRGTNCRLFFTAGDRAIRMATDSINGLRTIGISLSTSAAPGDVAEKIKILSEQVSEGKRREKRMTTEIAEHQARQLNESLKRSVGVFLHRPDEGMDFINRVTIEMDNSLIHNGVVLLCTGSANSTGIIVIHGREDLVAKLSTKVKDIVKTAKGGGKGAKWQGKVTDWGNGDFEALKNAVEEL